MNYDITFCDNINCNNLECKRNQKNVNGENIIISISNFENCEFYNNKK